MTRALDGSGRHHRQTPCMAQLRVVPHKNYLAVLDQPTGHISPGLPVLSRRVPARHTNGTTMVTSQDILRRGTSRTNERSHLHVAAGPSACTMSRDEQRHRMRPSQMEKVSILSLRTQSQMARGHRLQPQQLCHARNINGHITQVTENKVCKNRPDTGRGCGWWQSPLLAGTLLGLQPV